MAAFSDAFVIIQMSSLGKDRLDWVVVVVGGLRRGGLDAETAAIVLRRQKE